MSIPGKMIHEVLTHLFKKPATDQYPFTKPEVPEAFRGMIDFVCERCIGCKLCVRDCPADAITITKIGDKKFEATFALDRCIYCAQCVDSCNKDALRSTKNFELAQLDRSKLTVTFHLQTGNEAKPTEPSPAADPEKA